MAARHLCVLLLLCAPICCMLLGVMISFVVLVWLMTNADMLDGCTGPREIDTETDLSTAWPAL